MSAMIIGGRCAALLSERFGAWAVGFSGRAVMARVAAGLAFGLRATAAAAPAVAAAR